MTTFVFANNFSTTLAATASSSSTTLTLASSTGLPSLSSGEVMPLTLNDAATGQVYEIVYVTAISGATLTVTRGKEGTTAQSWAVGDYAYGAFTADSVAPVNGNPNNPFYGATPAAAANNTQLATTAWTVGYAAPGAQTDAVISAAGLTPDRTNTAQLLAGVKALFLQTSHLVAPAWSMSGEGVPIGANYNQSLTVSFTAPCDGTAVGFGKINPSSTASSAINAYLYIQSASISNDSTTVSQFHFGSLAVAKGDTVTVKFQITSGSTSPAVTATYGVMALFVPSN